MSTSRRSWWIVYFACAGAVVLALCWISAVVLDLEAAERQARAEAGHQERIRLALWRMDSWLAPELAREAARPYFEYAAFYPENRAYNPILNRLDPNEVLTRSALLNFRSDLVDLHFQIDSAGNVTSPQVPQGNFRDLAEATVLEEGQFDSNVAMLACVNGLEPELEIRENLGRLEEQVLAVMNERPLDDAVPKQTVDRGKQQELAGPQQGAGQGRRGVVQRTKGTYAAKNADAQWVAPDTMDFSKVRAGALVPMWLGGPGNQLIFVRRVQLPDGELFQGFLADWKAMRTGLLEQIQDLLPTATLLPVAEDVLGKDETGLVLATLPLTLSVPSAKVVAGSLWTPGRGALGVTWLAVLAAVGAVALTLRSSIAYAEKQSRFASTVTHELRTPLTTFRMYSEMLAEGMVTDEEQRALYLRTLQDESGRLATLVENVLAYARLEDGRATARRDHTTFGDLTRRVLPPLERRVADGDMVLDTAWEVDDAAALHVDVEAVGQILFNLVDNACKYGRSEDQPIVEVSASLRGKEIVLAVRDHGQGVPSAARRIIFDAFDRGGRGGDDAVPGVGLGLALC